jgi:hypothetical protein
VFRDTCLAGGEQHSHIYEPRTATMLNSWQVLLFLPSDCEPSTATDNTLFVQYALKFNFMDNKSHLRAFLKKGEDEEGGMHKTRAATRSSSILLCLQSGSMLTFLPRAPVAFLGETVISRVAVWKQFHLNQSFATNAGAIGLLLVSKQLFRNTHSNQSRQRTLFSVHVYITIYVVMIKMWGNHGT